MNNNKENQNPNPEELPKGGNSETPETQKYQKEKKELLEGLKKEKESLLHQIEEDQIGRDNSEAQEFMRQADFPHSNPEGNESPEYEELKKLFQGIPTDHVEYPLFRKFFPNFVRVGESTRIGENISADVVFLALGIAQSLASVLRLTGHLVTDTARLVFQPRKSIREAREFMQ